MATTVSPVPLVFFYKGDNVPPYATLSLTDAVQKWSGPVIFLTNVSEFAAPNGVEVIDFTDFYQDYKFLKFKNNSPLNAGFRDGFWFHTAERFFVLHQYSQRFGVTRFLHLELDVIFTNSRFDPVFMDQQQRGVFYPSGSKGHAGASIFAVTKVETLGEFVEFCIDNASVGDEMALLWSFQKLGRPDVFALPSHTFFETSRASEIPGSLSPDLVGGVYDVRAFGTWLLGQDPRNTPKGPTFNKFVFEDIGSNVLEGLTFAFNPISRRLVVKDGFGSSQEILCLHVHSKNLALALNPLALFAVVVLSRLPFRIPLSRQNLVRYGLRKAKEKIDTVYSAVTHGMGIRGRSG